MTEDVTMAALQEAADAWAAFVAARGRMNAAVPDYFNGGASRAEIAIYDERYKADAEAQREHHATAIRLAHHARDIMARLAAAETALEEARRAAIRAALCLSGFIGEGICIDDHEDPETAWSRVAEAVGCPHGDDDDLRAALTTPVQRQPDDWQARALAAEAALAAYPIVDVDETGKGYPTNTRRITPTEVQALIDRRVEVRGEAIEEARNLIESIARPFPLKCDWENKARSCQAVAAQALAILASLKDQEVSRG